MLPFFRHLLLLALDEFTMIKVAPGQWWETTPFSDLENPSQCCFGDLNPPLTTCPPPPPTPPDPSGSWSRGVHGELGERTPGLPCGAPGSGEPPSDAGPSRLDLVDSE